MRSRVKIVKNCGRYALFSEIKLQVCIFAFFHSFKFCPQPVDLFHLQGEVQGRSLVAFSTKLQMVKALRDPEVLRKYPTIAISKNLIIDK